MGLKCGPAMMKFKKTSQAIVACSIVALTHILRLTCSLAVISRSPVTEFVYGVCMCCGCVHVEVRGQ